VLYIQKFTFNPFSENTYVVYNDQKQAWLIDPGNLHEEETHTLQNFILNHDLKIEKILLTHAHIDHILGLQWAHNTYRVPVYLHPDEEEILKMGNLSAQRLGLDFENFKGETLFIEEGEKLNLGNEIFKIYFAPGHSPGHLIYHNEENKLAISGDVLFEGSIGRTDLYKGDFNQLIASIKTKLFTLDNETIIYSGHGNETTVGREKLTNPFLN